SQMLTRSKRKAAAMKTDESGEPTTTMRRIAVLGSEDFISRLSDDCIIQFCKHLNRKEIVELSCANQRMLKFGTEPTLM
ncbi:hypothetical protein PENTCL1PPCAC_19088, partial [Pristionchus entomophagus]